MLFYVPSEYDEYFLWYTSFQLETTTFALFQADILNIEGIITSAINQLTHILTFKNKVTIVVIPDWHTQYNSLAPSTISLTLLTTNAQTRKTAHYPEPNLTHSQNRRDFGTQNPCVRRCRLLGRDWQTDWTSRPNRGGGEGAREIAVAVQSTVRLHGGEALKKARTPVQGPCMCSWRTAGLWKGWKGNGYNWFQVKKSNFRILRWQTECAMWCKAYQRDHRILWPNSSFLKKTYQMLRCFILFRNNALDTQSDIYFQVIEFALFFKRQLLF